MKTSLSEKRAWPFFLMCILVAFYLIFIVQLSFTRLWPLWMSLAAGAILSVFLIRISCITENAGFSLPAMPAPFRFRIFAAFFLASSAIRLLYLLAYFPGGASSDTLIQWQQIRLSQFDDWHPALHTLYEWAVTRIIPHPGALLILQDLFFSLSVAYSCSVLWRWQLPKPFVLAVLAYLCLNPATANLLTFIWKDCAFATCILLLSGQILSIIFSRGKWLHPIRNQLAFSVVLCLCSILRHNGMAATLPVILWLLISLTGHRRPVILSAVICFLLYAGIRGPLYNAFHVTPAERRLEETYGVPITILSHVYAKQPDSLDAETRTFLETIAPQSVFAEYDSPGDWNETKWHVSPGNLDTYSLPQVFLFALRAFAAEPVLATEALSGLWRMPLLPFGNAYWRMSPYIESAESAAYAGYTFTMQGPPALRYLLNGICRHSAGPLFSWLFWNPGFPLLLVMLACVAFAGNRPAAALTLPAMMIGYSFATALVLSSPTDFRFFLCIPLSAPLALAGLIALPQPGPAGTLSVGLRQ